MTEHALNDSWKTDWASFVEYIAQGIERGETSKSLSARIASERVHWRGRVAELRLGARYASGFSLRMDEIRRALNNGFTLIGRHLFLKIQDPEQKVRLSGLKTGDLVEFYSTIGRGNQVFHPLELAFHEAEKTIYIEIHMRGAELVVG